MSSNDLNVIKDLKKMYYSATFSDLYGGSVFATVFIIVIFTLLVIYYDIMTQSQEIRNDWANQRCSPRIIPFAGIINAPPEKSQFEYTAENFTFCINGIVEDTASMATSPITWLVSIVTNVLKLIGAAVQKIRAFFDKLRLMFMKIISDIYQLILSVIIPLQQTIISLLDLFGKMNGLFQVALGQAEGSYNLLASSIGAIYEFIVIILLALAAVIIVLWLIPVTWGAAAGMTTIFIAIMIPLAIIAIWLDIIFGLSGSRIPGVPSCFDENTIIKDNKNNNVKIKNIKVGTKLEDGSIVTSKMKMRAKGHDMYKINNVIVSGNHKIIHKNKLIKVKNLSESQKIEYTKPYIYCLNTTNKCIKTNQYIWQWQKK